MMIGHRRVIALAILILTLGVSGCQRENPVEKSQAPQPSPSVDAIQTPMDKARGVEGTLSGAADRTADRIQEGTQ